VERIPSPAPRFSFARSILVFRLSRPVNGPSPRWGEGRVRGALRK
jgi:hypothetical protein